MVKSIDKKISARNYKMKTKAICFGLINAGQICTAKCNNFLPAAATAPATETAAANSFDSFALPPHTHK